MNSKTGAIAQFESAADAKRAGFDIDLTAEEAAALLGMERADRLTSMLMLRADKPLPAPEPFVDFHEPAPRQPVRRRHFKERRRASR